MAPSSKPKSFSIFSHALKGSLLDRRIACFLRTTSSLRAAKLMASSFFVIAALRAAIVAFDGRPPLRVGALCYKYNQLC